MTELQKRILDVYKDFKMLCDDHGLRYYAEGGTKIGAAFWQGFIPWDDDVDVSMPLVDYLRFIELCQEPDFLPADRQLFNGLEVEGSDIFFLKLHDIKTTFIDRNVILNPTCHTGVFIDIMPMIGSPSEDAEANEFAVELDRSVKEMFLARTGESSKSYLDKMKRQYVSLMQKYDYETSEMILQNGSRWDSRLEQFAKIDFDNSTEMAFCDTTIKLPLNYRAQLDKQYGGCKKYPPKNDRKSFHAEAALVDLDKSFASYQQEIKENNHGAKLTQFIIDQYGKLLYEKQDILSRIPPLEDRIQLELAELSIYRDTPSIHTAYTQLMKAVKAKLRHATRR